MVATVRTSVLEVAEAFLRPASYTVGVLHLIIHRAEDLPKTDAVGE